MVLFLKVDGFAPARRLCHYQEGSRAGAGRPEAAGKMAGKRRGKREKGEKAKRGRRVDNER
jgi:hypothetical protein